MLALKDNSKLCKCVYHGHQRGGRCGHQHTRFPWNGDENRSVNDVQSCGRNDEYVLPRKVPSTGDLDLVDRIGDDADADVPYRPEGE